MDPSSAEQVHDIRARTENPREGAGRIPNGDGVHGKERLGRERQPLHKSDKSVSRVLRSTVAAWHGETSFRRYGGGEAGVPGGDQPEQGKVRSGTVWFWLFAVPRRQG